MNRAYALFQGTEFKHEDAWCRGSCSTHYSPVNAVDCAHDPVGIVVHELTHAAMAWCRWCGTDVRTHDGEEVLAYAIGRMLLQLNNILCRSGFYDRRI